jgi:hypothetical protein
LISVRLPFPDGDMCPESRAAICKSSAPTSEGIRTKRKYVRSGKYAKKNVGGSSSKSLTQSMIPASRPPIVADTSNENENKVEAGTLHSSVKFFPQH